MLCADTLTVFLLCCLPVDVCWRLRNWLQLWIASYGAMGAGLGAIGFVSGEMSAELSAFGFGYVAMVRTTRGAGLLLAWQRTVRRSKSMECLVI